MSKLKYFYSNCLRPGLFTFSIVLSSLMLIAANWQWTRYQEKLDLVETYKKHSTKSDTLITLEEIKSNISIFENKKIKIKGYFDFENQFIVSNRRNEHGAGSWLLTPFILNELAQPDQKNSILVSRGFIPYEDREKVSWNKYNLEKTNNPVEIEGVLVASRSKRTFLSPSAKTKNEYIFTYPDLELISKSIPYDCNTNFFLHGILDPVHNGYPQTDIRIDVPPSTHFWYTFEWIGLAFMTQVICLLIQIFRPKNLINKSIILFFLFYPSNLFATPDPKSVPQKAGIIERLGETIDLTLEFEKEDGEIIKLSTFFDGNKPVIIAPVYFECPRLCSLTQEGLFKSITESDLVIGKDYHVLSISFNDLETSKQSSKRAEVYRKKFPNELIENSKSWNFLTGKKESTTKLMEQIGFKYEYDRGEFMHAAGVLIITPAGKISRYLYGVEYSSNDFKMALIEASKGQIGSFMNRALMYCFRYDHIKGQYTLAIWQIIRILCCLFVVLLFIYIYYLKKKEKN